jgi:hypothetical protein
MLSVCLVRWDVQWHTRQHRCAKLQTAEKQAFLSVLFGDTFGVTLDRFDTLGID